MNDEWAELGIALKPDKRSSADALFDRVRTVLPPDVPWWFMRKPPDVRLRIGGVTASEVTARLDLVSVPGVEHVETRIYEPETRKFGGREAMAAAHGHFVADSRAWAEHGRDLHAPTVVAAVGADLLRRLLEDYGDVWDAWCNVVELGAPGSLGDDCPRVAGSLGPGVDLAALPSALSRQYAAVNNRLALDVDAAGAMNLGRRAFGALVVQYHAHRWGLDGRATAELAWIVAAANDPLAQLRGRRS